MAERLAARAAAHRQPAGARLPHDPPQPRVLDDAPAARAARAAELPRRPGRLRVLRRPRPGDPAAGELRHAPTRWPARACGAGARTAAVRRRCAACWTGWSRSARERGGFLAWEHFFAFGSGAPPWISAMTQATGAQALARGRRALGRRARYARAARRALGAFDARAAARRRRAGGAAGVRYAMYSFAPDLRILNGELQTLIGLRDVARISGSRRARRLFARGEPVGAARGARRSTPARGRCTARAARSRRWATTASSRASSAGCAGAPGRATYCAAGRRFVRYVARAAAGARAHARASCARAGARRSASRCRRSPT